MEHKLQIQKHVNLADEAFFLFYVWMNKDSFEEDSNRYAANYEPDLDNYLSKCDLITEISDNIKEHFKERRDRIEYYFKSRNEDYFTYASLAVLWNFHNYTNHLIPYEQQRKELPEEERLRLYASLIDNESVAGISKDTLKTLPDLITYLDTLTFSEEVKWEVVKIYNHQKLHYEEASLILQEAVEFLQSQYGERIAVLEQEFFSYWSGVQEKESILEIFQRKLSITLNSEKEGTILLPIIFNPFSVSVSMDQEDTESWDVMRIGILMDERFILGSKKLNKEEVVNLGKLLCDKSKVDILEMTSRKPCYGKELANELGLSTATISYHVSALMKIGFLKVDVEANKVYYSMNREQVARYLEDVKDYFNHL